jgi:hypothetical protein
MPATQSYADHARWHPLFHFFVLPVLLLLLPLYCVVSLVRYPSIRAAMLLLSALAIAGLTWCVRLYATGNQDRIIALEERLRLDRLVPPSGREAAARLTDDQLVGLRFASDAELAELAASACAENLSRDAIKKRVKIWRPDFRRV